MLLLASAVAAVAVCTGCENEKDRSKGTATKNLPKLIVVVIDETGSFLDQKLWEPSRKVAGELVSCLLPGDAFCVVGIDATPYTPDDVRIEVTELSEGTLLAAIERKELYDKVQKLSPRPSRGKGSPLSLVIAYVAEEILVKEQAKHRLYLVIFSDMAEDPTEGGKEFEDLSRPIVIPAGTEVRCFNVIPFGSREEYRQRVTLWKQTFARWGVTTPVELNDKVISPKKARDLIRELRRPPS
jgi:hypothetical protein